MKHVNLQLRRLENRLAPPPEERLCFPVTRIDRELALDASTCIDILEECGYLPNILMCVVNLANIPDGLDAAELEHYLCAHGHELVNPPGRTAT
jgi:hypothetical protein